MSTNTQAILFDMDGTLLDTAPDMFAALERLCAEEQVALPNYVSAQNQISRGVAGILELTFNITPDSDEFIDKRDRYLFFYSQALGQKTRLFSGLEQSIDYLVKLQIPWGIVTSKVFRFANPLLQVHPCLASSQCLIAGDTVSPGKPDPAPLYAACKHLDVNPEATFYIGDAEKDIAAGNNAGMKTLIADWGYIGAELTPEQWQADYRLAKSEQLLEFLQQLDFTS